MSLKGWVSPLLAMALVACATQTPPLQGENLVVLPLTELPKAEGATRDYRMGGFDTVTIDVFGVEELSRRDIQMDSNGNGSFPLVGTINAKGMTLEQFAREIERRLAGRYVRDPHVSVNLKEAVSQNMTVDGGVKRPGLYPVVGDMTLMRAVARAEGLSEDAKVSEVVVFRTVNGQRLAALYDLSAIRGGRYADPEIYANDIVIVGNSPAQLALRNLVQIGSLAVTPLVVLLQRL